MSKKNLFCSVDDLINEADVEQIFARRLIEYIGYKDLQIRPKNSLTELAVGEMRGSEALYRPDFAVKIKNVVRWIFEVRKSGPSRKTTSRILPLDQRPIQNGESRPILCAVQRAQNEAYQWDVNDPILELDFEDVAESSEKFKQFISVLSPNSFSVSSDDYSIANTDVHLEKRSLEEVNAAFAWCHQQHQSNGCIHRIKVVFLKLLSDRKMRDKYPNFVVEEAIDVPADEVNFSTKWIESKKSISRIH